MGTDELGEEAGHSGSPLRVRAFFGLPLPEEHRAELETYLEGCTRLAPAFRWTPAANLHFTVRFLGHLDDAVARAIAERVAQAAPAAFEMRLGEVGTFRRGRLARVVWIGLALGEDEAAALARLVESECVAAGLEAETRPFRGHLTLARARERDGAALPELPPLPVTAPWRAGELVLYRSHLGRGGSVYEPLRRITLR